MSDHFTQDDAVNLLGATAHALIATQNARSGEVGEVVRADPDHGGYVICVEWGGLTEMPPRFDFFTKPQSLKTLNFKRRTS